MDGEAYTILVNSTDSYEECWQPFFTLFRKFWPDCKVPIILNTEIKEFSVSELDVRTSKVLKGQGKRDATWSECLLRCLDQIETDVILYLQEDYFLNASVNVGALEKYVKLLSLDEAVCIRLMEPISAGPWMLSDHESAWEVSPHSRFFLHLQAGLWKRSALERVVRPHESPWQLEFYGSRRLRRAGEKVLCVNRDLYNDRAGWIFPYDMTGIVSGRWKREIVCELFAKHGIDVDFSKRGFYDPTQWSGRRGSLLRRALGWVRSQR